MNQPACTHSHSGQGSERSPQIRRLRGVTPPRPALLLEGVEVARSDDGAAATLDRPEVEGLHPVLDNSTRHTNVRHAAQAVARHLTDSDEAHAAAEAGDDGCKGLALSASTEPPPLLARHLRRTRAEQVVDVGRRLTVLAEDERAHLREGVQAVADRRGALRAMALVEAVGMAAVLARDLMGAVGNGARAVIASARRRVHPAATKHGLDVKEEAAQRLRGSLLRRTPRGHRAR